METTYSTNGGWLDNRQTSSGWFDNRQTTTGYSTGIITKFLLTASLSGVLLLDLGTGASTDDLNRLKQKRDESFISNQVRHSAVEVIHVRTSVDNIERIREVLNPAVSDLAKCFGVSRQTIYNWQNGEQPTAVHEARLNDLALAADVFAESGVSVSGNLLKRKVFNGKNLFEVVQNGRSARDAAQFLLQIVRRETSQREILSARLAGRIESNFADSDLMPANDEV